MDATLGGGGHSSALLESREDLQVLGLEQDEEALASATARLSSFGLRFRALRTNFRHMREALEGQAPSGILMDLGVSSHQLDTPARGFSFQQEGPLDMRMDVRQPLKAAEIIAQWSEEELARIIWELGEDRRSRHIARAIVEARSHYTIRTTAELAEIVARASGPRGSLRIHPATRTFQALRMTVNDELGALADGIQAAWDCLPIGGRLVVISFHSLEDRVVKYRFREWGQEEGSILTRKPMQASPEEERSNPRSRSAKLRAIERTLLSPEKIVVPPVRDPTQFKRKH